MTNKGIERLASLSLADLRVELKKSQRKYRVHMRLTFMSTMVGTATGTRPYLWPHASFVSWLGLIASICLSGFLLAGIFVKFRLKLIESRISSTDLQNGGE